MIDTDLKQISLLLDTKLEPIQKQLQEHNKTLKSHSKLLKVLKKNQDTMLYMLDKKQMEQRKRIDRVEKHLNLPSNTA